MKKLKADLMPFDVNDKEKTVEILIEDVKQRKSTPKEVKVYNGGKERTQKTKVEKTR